MESALFWFYGLPTGLICLAIGVYAAVEGEYPKIARIAFDIGIIGIAYYAILILFIIINK